MRGVPGEIRTFRDFWPYYLGEHSSRANRALHFVGTTCAIGSIVAAASFGLPALLWGAPLLGYGLAWTGHLFVEKNRPATFRYPLYSLAADLRLWALMLTRRLGTELSQAPRS